MSNSSPFQLVMISAMYENGGNVTHRLLDGHPELYVYPFESQLGNNVVVDYFHSLFPFKYRWPNFPVQEKLEDIYELFYDEEFKVRIRTPQVSKFRIADIKVDEKERKKIFVDWLKDKPRTRANIIEAFFRATFGSWQNLKRSGKERIYVGYSPIIGVDGDKIIADFPTAHILHVVRNPYSAYAETKYRPFPLSLERYVITWNLVQHIALMYTRCFPNNFHIIRYEDFLQDPKQYAQTICQKLNISFSETMLYPSWNGKPLENVYPWGIINEPTKQENQDRIEELSDEEKAKIKNLSAVMLKELGYENLW